MGDDLELKEAAERAKENKSLAPISLTMAILAVFVATVSLLGHRAHTEEVLTLTRATDQWAYYQAKNIRRNTLESLSDMLTALETSKMEEAKKVQDKFQKEIEHFRDQQKEIEGEARGLEQEVSVERRRADRFDLGEVLLEVALVITSITLLTERRIYWATGLVFAVLGMITAASGFLVR
jgi:HSP90 family molecular chaperone